MSASSSAGLTDRDRRIVQLVARYGQLTTHHVRILLFESLSDRPVYRALNRLTERGYLIRLERRLVGGSRGGSGQFCYSLGRRGFYMLYDGKYTPARSIRHHTLAVADCVVTFKELERAGTIQVSGISAEPDCWYTIGSTELKPDLYVELVTKSGKARALFLEVDMGSEGQKQIMAKMARYARVQQDPTSDAIWPTFPGVLWVAVDEERAKELRWIISRLDAHMQALFRVVELSRLASVFG